MLEQVERYDFAAELLVVNQLVPVRVFYLLGGEDVVEVWKDGVFLRLEVEARSKALLEIAPAAIIAFELVIVGGQA